MGITTKDLAQLCGVSRTTVHRALYGGGRIHPDTKEMILRVAKEHDYRPDLLARGLVKGRTYYIGVVVMDVRNRYFAGMLSAIGREAAQHGYNINITLHDNNRKFEQDQLGFLPTGWTESYFPPLMKGRSMQNFWKAWRHRS